MITALWIIGGIIAFGIVAAALADNESRCRECGNKEWSDWTPCHGMDMFGFVYRAKKKTCINCGNEKVDYRSR